MVVVVGVGSGAIRRVGGKQQTCSESDAALISFCSVCTNARPKRVGASRAGQVRCASSGGLGSMRRPACPDVAQDLLDLDRLPAQVLDDVHDPLGVGRAQRRLLAALQHGEAGGG